MSQLPPTGPLPRAGTPFGPYRIEQQIGVGGMGAVFLATDLRLGRRVAVKVLLGTHAQEPAYLQRFQREATIMARLDSPHVLGIFDHGVHEGWPFIVTQYAAGGDLGRLIRERGPLPPGLAARVCSQVADALVAAHAVGVVHRDVKPANVLIRDASLDRLDRMHVYLADFGVAHTGSTGLTTAGAVAGTWNYLAPERAEGTPGSPATDVYAVGCLLWETLTGAPPYTGSDVEVAMAHLQEPVRQLPEVDDFTRRANPVLARAMAKDPAHRPATALQLREEVRALAPSGVAPSFTGAAPLRRRSRRLRLVAAAVALLLAAGAGTAYWLLRDDDDPPAGSPSPGPDDPTTPTEPAPDPAVTGDLDGDGLGDAGYVDSTAGVLRRWSSTGSAFGAAGRRSPAPGDAVLAGDVTGDERVDLVEVDGDRSIVAVTVRSGAGGRQLSPATVPVDDDKAYLLGDVDGDGHDDLVAAAWSTRRLQVSVAPGTDSGTLGQSRRWYAGRLGDSESVALATGDLDGDGDDDLVLARYDGGVPTLAVLRAEDRRFRAGAAQPERSLDGGSGFFRVADLQGDDRPELLFVPRYSYDGPVRVWDLAGDTLSQQRPRNVAAVDRLASVSVSDVDGDGRDDLVLWPSDDGSSDKVSRMLVARSEGDRLAASRVWLDFRRVDAYGHAVDRVSDLVWDGYDL